MFLEGKSLELLIAAIVALVVVGPKDLPILLRKFGQFMARLRGMAAEFRASFDEMARQSELDELRKEVEALRQGQLTDQAAHAAGLHETNAMAAEINQSLSDVGVSLHEPHAYAPAELPAEPAAPVTVKKVAKARGKVAAAKPAAARKAPAKATTKAGVSTKPAARKAPAKKGTP